VEDVSNERPAEGFVRERQPGRVADHERERQMAFPLLDDLGEHGGGQVDADHIDPRRRERQGDQTGADPDLQARLAAGELGTEEGGGRRAGPGGQPPALVVDLRDAVERDRLRRTHAVRR